MAEKIIRNAKDEFELDEKGIDKLLESFNQDPTIDLKSEEGIEKWLTELKMIY